MPSAITHLNMKSKLEFNLQDKKILKIIYNCATSRKLKLYLVGGILRDLILQRKKANPDFDFCLKSGALNFGRQLAHKLGAGFVILDEVHAACRVVKKIRNQIYTFDFTDFRALNLEGDLRHRDFTINALALKLEDVFINKDLGSLIIDLYSGRADLKSKIIRVTSADSFREDPLRILRAFSFGCRLDFQLDKEVLFLAKKNKHLLATVSGERIRDELFKIFDTQQAYTCLTGLDKLKILEIIFPEIKPMRKIGQGPYHHLDVWQHTLETLRQFEMLLESAKQKPEMSNYLNAELSGSRSRGSLLKLVCLLHDIGKPKALRREKRKIIFHGHERIGLGLTRIVCRRLKLANDESRSLERMVLWHLRPGYLASNVNPSERAIFRYFRDTGQDALGVLLLSLADQRATKGPLTTALSRTRHEKIVKALVRRLFKKNQEKSVPRILDGNDLMRKFKLPPGRFIGQLLGKLEEAQGIGKIKNKFEAFKFAKKLIK